MSAPFFVALPTQLRRRGEIVGLIGGLACLPFAFFGQSLGRLFPTGPTGVVLPVVLASAMAGFVACVVRLKNDAPIAPGFAPRIGLRAGIVTAVVGGALTVFAATLHATGIGHAPFADPHVSIFALLLPDSRPSQVFVLVLLSIPPAIFFGLFGAFAPVLLRLSASPQQSPAPPSKDREIRGGVWVAVIALAIIGYLSPVGLLFRSASPAAAPAILAVPALSPDASPKWRYEKPADFDSTDPSRYTIVETRVIEGVADQLPVALSPDGKLFAFCRNSPQFALEVRDLDSLDVIARTEIPQQPSTVAWAPNGKRILLAGEGEDRRLQVFDLSDSKLIPLPQPVEVRVPEGIADWWSEQEVLFASSGNVQLLLLDTLRVHPPALSSKWKALSPDQQERIRKGAGELHLPVNSRWKMTPHPAIRRYVVPINPAATWVIDESLQLGVVHPKLAYTSQLAGANVSINDVILATADGTKFVRIRDQQATVFYLGIRAEPTTRFKVAMPKPAESTLVESLAKKGVCGFICSPIINPLNGKVVGPDRALVKALARISAWNDKEAEFWIEEDHLPVQPGDVVADLHTWEERIPRPAGELGKNEWFAVIEKLDSTSPPSRSEAPALDRGYFLAANSRRGADRVEEFRAASPKRQPVPAPPPPPSMPAPRQTETVSVAPPQTIQPSEHEKLLTAFIKAHHAKSTRGDVEGVVSDYADRVDHFTNGMVDRAFIQKDELAYHAPGTRLIETITSPPEFTRVDPVTYSVTYSISFHHTRPDGRWTKGFSDIEMRIFISQAGPRITRHRAQNRDTQKGP